MDHSRAQTLAAATLHPAAGDARAANAVLLAAIARCDELLAIDLGPSARPTGPELAELVAALEALLGEPLDLRDAGSILERMLPLEDADQYRNDTAHAARVFADGLERLAARFDRQLARAGAREIEALVLQAHAQRARRLPRAAYDEHARRMSAALTQQSLEPALRLQRELLWNRPYGAAAGAVLTHENAPQMLRHRDAAIRRAVAALTAQRALELAPVIEPLKRGRLGCVIKSARLLGYEHPYERFQIESGVTEAALAALAQQSGPLRAFCERYAAWKHGRLLAPAEPLLEVDFSTRARGAGDIDLSFGRAVAATRACSGLIDAAYPAIIDEMAVSGSMLSDCGATRSSEWVCVSSLSGGLPLLHMPYTGDFESFIGAAHEIGHGCQVTASVRRRGGLSQHNAPLWFVESCSLRCEIEVVHAALASARSDGERAFWAEAAIDQWLHVMRTLQIAARFDCVLYERPDAPLTELCAAREAIRRQLSPKALHAPIDGDDLGWLLLTTPEELPYAGFQYGLAMLIAYRSKLDRLPLAELADGGAQLPIHEACSRFLSLDVADPRAYEPIWRQLDALLDTLLATA